MNTKYVVSRKILFSMIIILLTFGIPGSAGKVIAQQPGPQATEAAPLQSPEAADPNASFAILPAAPEMPEEVSATTQYQHVSGSVFVSLYDTAQSVYAGSGCKYVTGSNLFLNYPLVLPSNATVTQVRLYFKDTNPSINGTFHFARYDDGLAYQYLTTLTTTGSAGWGTATTAVDVPLDYANYSYTMVWISGVGDSTMQFCGYRVGYTTPGVFGVALPVVRK
jgi:hypothetical protein